MECGLRAVMRSVIVLVGDICQMQNWGGEKRREVAPANTRESAEARKLT
jgi:hypothetical protein